MANKRTISRQDSFAETCSSIISGVISFFLLALVTVFPLIYDKAYFNILETKYKCYYIIVIGMLVVLLVLALIMLVVDINEFKGEHVAKLLAALKPQNWKQTFCVADAGVLVFWLMCGISTLQSKYLYESFWGNEGRYSGLFLITLYVAFYFVVSRFWKVKGWILELFLISGLVMCYIGITDYFQLDILHFRGRVKPEQSTIFTSTVGNINTYTAYVSMLMGLSAAMFATAKNVLKSIWYYVCMVVAFFAIIMGCSDNAYLAIGAMFAFLPFILFRNKRGVVRYLAMVATFATVIQCIDYINQAYADMVIGLDSLFQILVNFRGLMVVVVALWAAVAALYFLWYRRDAGVAGGIGKSAQNRGGQSQRGSLQNRQTGWASVFSGDDREAGNLGSRFVRAWGIFVVLGVLAICVALFDANALGNGARYGGLGSYLVFNDQWGTNRGYIWRKSFEVYRDFPMMHKLFGYGPDTFGILTTRTFLAEMKAATGQTFDSAHNEYIQFLITIGPIGLAAYLTFLIGGMWRMVKRVASNPYMIGCLCGVLCYVFQALVNLNLPIATPMMWMLMSAGIAAGWKEKRTEAAK